MIRILDTDIETGPNTAFMWSPRTRFIPKDHVIETSRTLCYAYRWHGEGKVQFASEWDERMDHIERMWQLLDEADAVVTYNGDRFDLKVLNWEFAQRGMPPPSPYHSIDLFKPVKKHFRMPYYALDYVTGRLNLGRKVKHMGMQLWADVLDSDPRAQAMMERYNKRDVTLMRPLYKHLLPWIHNHPNVALYMEPAKNGKPRCTRCGKTTLEPIKPKSTKVQKYPQYRCTSCQSVCHERKGMIPASDSGLILTH